MLDMYSNSIYGDKLFLLNNLYLKSDNGMLKIAVRIMINKRKIIKDINIDVSP